MGSEGSKGVAAFMEMLRSHEVVSYVQQAMATYDDDLQPPSSLDGGLAQALVLFCRRVAGRPSVAQADSQEAEVEPVGYRYVSPETEARLRALEEKARVLGSIHGVDRLLALDEVRARVVDDLGAAAARDGLATDRESLRRVIVGGQPPCDGTERFLQMAFEEFCRLLDGGHPFTTATLFCVHGFLSQSADECGIPVRPVASRWPMQSSFKIPPALLGPGSISCSATMFEERGSDPLYSVLMVSDSIWELESFPSWNGLMEVMARATAFSAYDLSALALVPFSRLRLDWECGLSGCPERFSYGSALVVSAYGNDSTSYLLQMLSMFEEGLHRLEASVAAHDSSMAARLGAVEGDQRLNLRQRQFLREAIAGGGCREADVHAYGKRFDVALTTARSDLNQLAALGWLRAEYEGKRQVFVLA